MYNITVQQETGHKLFYMTVSISIFRGTAKGAEIHTPEKAKRKTSLVKFFRVCSARVMNGSHAKFYGLPNRQELRVFRAAYILFVLFFIFPPF